VFLTTGEHVLSRLLLGVTVANNEKPMVVVSGFKICYILLKKKASQLSDCETFEKGILETTEDHHIRFGVIQIENNTKLNGVSTAFPTFT
jgi:hypothetical protein